jgi:hypothetical protein
MRGEWRNHYRTRESDTLIVEVSDNTHGRVLLETTAVGIYLTAEQVDELIDMLRPYGIASR